MGTTTKIRLRPLTCGYPERVQAGFPVPPTPVIPRDCAQLVDTKRPHRQQCRTHCIATALAWPGKSKPRSGPLYRL